MRLVAYREDTWMDRKTDFRQWDHLARAYGAELILVEQNDKLPNDGVVVVLDQIGVTPLSEFVHPEECSYLFGHTGLNNLPDLISHRYSVRIATPKDISLFGVTAAAIVLHDRAVKK